MCSEIFQKNCQITFKKSATTEKIRQCYTPLKKICDGTGPETCKTLYETSCTSRYVDKSGNGTQFVGDTTCQKIPVEICGQGCRSEEAEEDCHEKSVIYEHVIRHSTGNHRAISHNSLRWVKNFDFLNFHLIFWSQNFHINAKSSFWESKSGGKVVKTNLRGDSRWNVCRSRAF